MGSGVYKRSSEATVLGGHGIKIIGWGTENGEDYWLCVNSWNEEWGDKGLFKIARGSNECGIEKGVVAGEVTGEAPGSVSLVWGAGRLHYRVDWWQSRKAVTQLLFLAPGQ